MYKPDRPQPFFLHTSRKNTLAMQRGDVVHFRDYAVPEGSGARPTVFPPWLAVVQEIEHREPS